MNNKRGLTLLEVIVASLILAITVGGVLYVFSTEKGVVARTGRRVQAMDFARQTLEDLKNAVTAAGPNAWPGGTLAETATGTNVPVALSPGQPSDFRDKFGATRTYTVTNMNPDSAGDPADYKSVTVTVNWGEPAETQ